MIKSKKATGWAVAIATIIFLLMIWGPDIEFGWSEFLRFGSSENAKGHPERDATLIAMLEANENPVGACEEADFRKDECAFELMTASADHSWSAIVDPVEVARKKPEIFMGKCVTWVFSPPIDYAKVNLSWEVNGKKEVHESKPDRPVQDGRSRLAVKLKDDQVKPWRTMVVVTPRTCDF